MIKKLNLSRKIIFVCVCFVLGSCGYRGALYLPDQPPENQQQQTETDIPSNPESNVEPK